MIIYVTNRSGQLGRALTAGLLAGAMALSGCGGGDSPAGDQVPPAADQEPSGPAVAVPDDDIPADWEAVSC